MENTLFSHSPQTGIYIFISRSTLHIHYPTLHSHPAPIDMQGPDWSSTFTGASLHKPPILHKQPVCHPRLWKHPGTKVSAVNRDADAFQPKDKDGEGLVFSTPPEPTTHPGQPYVFAKACSRCHWLSIQSIEPQCLLFIGCLEDLTGYTDKTLIKTSSVTSCDLKAACVLEPFLTAGGSSCFVRVSQCYFKYKGKTLVTGVEKRRNWYKSTNLVNITDIIRIKKYPILSLMLYHSSQQRAPVQTRPGNWFTQQNRIRVDSSHCRTKMENPKTFHQKQFCGALPRVIHYKSALW